MTVTAPDLKAFLLATPFFGGLSDGGLDLLVSMLAERRFDSGATVVAEDEPGRSMFIVRPACGEQTDEYGQRHPDLRSGARRFFRRDDADRNAEPLRHIGRGSATVLYELTVKNLYACYKADIHAYVIVRQNINRELCRRLRRADERFPRRTAGSDNR